MMEMIFQEGISDDIESNVQQRPEMRKSIKGYMKASTSEAVSYSTVWILKPDCLGSNLVIPLTSLMASFKLYVSLFLKLEILQYLPHRVEFQELIIVLGT